MPEKIPSKYQLDIRDAYDDWGTNPNIFVTAGPGSGKSHTILDLLNRTPRHKKAILTAFNKSISEELGRKVPPGTEVSTIHSLGFRVMRKNMPSIKFRVMQEEGVKTYILIKEVIKPCPGLESPKKFAAYLFTLAKLYNLYRLNLADKTVESLQQLADEYSVDYFGPRFFEDTIVTIDRLNEYNQRHHRGETMIDYTDMLWFPYRYIDKSLFPKYDVVFIDEVQDVNPIQRELMVSLKKSSGRFVVVGDEKQSIYSFMGSNLKSLNTFREMPNTKVLPLSISYRFGKNIAEYANRIFPNSVEGYDQNPDGIIRKGSLLEALPGDFVLCRNNMPLVEAFLEFVSNNIPSTILGRDFGMELCKLIDSIEDLDGLGDILEKKYSELKNRGVEQPVSHKSYVALREKVDIIKMVVARTRKSLTQVQQLFYGLFSENQDKDKITMSSIHKSKGLQAKRVFFLQPELIPSQYAKTELELYQEKCTMFVAVTRCMEELIIVKKQLFYDYIQSVL